MFGEGETLGDEVVIHEGKGTGGEEIGRDVKIASVSCALGEGRGAESMGWDMGEGGGENGVFRWVEWRRSFVLIRMVGAATSPYSK